MTKLKFCLTLLLVGLAASFADAQTFLKTTTLSASITSPSTTTIPLASTTGIVATQSVIYVADGSGEAMFVNSVGTNYVGVTRGYQNLGGGTVHNSGALVFYGPANAFLTVQPTGACSRTAQIYLPAIALGLTGTPSSISDCLGGVWVNGVTSYGAALTPKVVFAPSPGGSVLTGVGTSTATTNTSMYCVEADLPFNKLLSGLQMLNGTAVGNGNRLVALYDASGNLLANSATAGALTANASNYQSYAFTSAYYAVGPALYFACSQTASSSDTLNMIVTADGNAGLLTKAITGQTFGTIPATITVPTTFTTAVGPYAAFY